MVFAFPSGSKFNNVPETPREKQLRERREEEERRLADSTTEDKHGQILFYSLNKPSKETPREKQLRERREEEESRLADSTEDKHGQILFYSLNKPSKETPREKQLRERREADEDNHLKQKQMFEFEHLGKKERSYKIDLDLYKKKEMKEIFDKENNIIPAEDMKILQNFPETVKKQFFIIQNSYLISLLKNIYKFQIESSSLLEKDIFLKMSDLYKFYFEEEYDNFLKLNNYQNLLSNFYLYNRAFSGYIEINKIIIEILDDDYNLINNNPYRPINIYEKRNFELDEHRSNIFKIISNNNRIILDSIKKIQKFYFFSILMSQLSLKNIPQFNQNPNILNDNLEKIDNLLKRFSEIDLLIKEELEKQKKEIEEKYKGFVSTNYLEKLKNLLSLDLEERDKIDIFLYKIKENFNDLSLEIKNIQKIDFFIQKFQENNNGLYKTQFNDFLDKFKEIEKKIDELLKVNKTKNDFLYLEEQKKREEEIPNIIQKILENLNNKIINSHEIEEIQKDRIVKNVYKITYPQCCDLNSQDSSYLSRYSLSEINNNLLEEIKTNKIKLDAINESNKKFKNNYMEKKYSILEQIFDKTISYISKIDFNKDDNENIEKNKEKIKENIKTNFLEEISHLSKLFHNEIIIIQKIIEEINSDNDFYFDIEDISIEEKGILIENQGNIFFSEIKINYTNNFLKNNKKEYDNLKKSFNKLKNNEIEQFNDSNYFDSLFKDFFFRIRK
ncbi:MAG: hypothetical protein Q8885_00695 [Candidatus Phytoplasma stylosanthis]|nr:hypothetical protein [Candidatus Phytoplasma stylosanthis]